MCILSPPSPYPLGLYTFHYMSNLRNFRADATCHSGLRLIAQALCQTLCSVLVARFSALTSPLSDVVSDLFWGCRSEDGAAGRDNREQLDVVNWKVFRETAPQFEGAGFGG